MAGASNPELSALRLAKPSEFQRKVRAAVEKAGSIPGAATALGVGRATLFRWIAEMPGLVDGIKLPEAKTIARGETNTHAAGPREKPAERPLATTGRRAHSAVVRLPNVDPERFVVVAVALRRDALHLTDDDLAALREAMPAAEKLSDLLKIVDPFSVEQLLARAAALYPLPASLAPTPPPAPKTGKRSK